MLVLLMGVRSLTSKSPCQKICKLDPITDICTVCGRTMQQIQAWTIYTDEQRSHIMKDLKAKRKLKNELGRIN